MKFISTQTHGIIDYFMSGVLIASPWVFNFYKDGPETWLIVVMGISAVIVNLMTDYKYAMIREISMQLHLTIDFLGGALLAASPWIFGFYQYVFMPHLVLGILVVLASITTMIPAHTSNKIAYK